MFEYAGYKVSLSEKWARREAAAAKQLQEKQAVTCVGPIGPTAPTPAARAIWAAKEATAQTNGERLTPLGLTHIAAAYLGVDEKAVYSLAHNHNLSQCRQIVWYLLKINRPAYWTQQRLGEIYSRDHTTVLVGLRRIGDKIATSEKFARSLDELVGIIEGTGKWIS